MTDRNPAIVIVRRTLPATPDVVFGEWLDAAALADFLRPTATTETMVECDPRVGDHERGWTLIANRIERRRERQGRWTSKT